MKEKEMTVGEFMDRLLSDGGYAMLDDVRQLVELQDQYIKHLAKWISDTAVYLDVHGIKPLQKDIDKGEELRNKIKKLKAHVG